MKNLIIFSIFLLISLIISSCFPYNQIIKENDNYKNEDKVYIVFRAMAKPNKTNLGIINSGNLMELKFEKVYQYNQDSLKHIKMYIEGTLAPNQFLENPVFIKTYENIHEFHYNTIDNIYNDKLIETKQDSTQITSSTKSSEKIIRSSVNLPQSLLKEIINSKLINIRIYLNEHPYDIELKLVKLNKLKKFIKVNPHRSISIK